MFKTSPFLLTLLLMISGLITHPAWAANDNPPVELSFGIVPQQSATELARVWIPLIQETASRSGVRLVFRTATDIPTFEDRLKKGEYDLAYMNPYHYTVFHQKPGYQAFAKEKDRKLVGIVVVPHDSPITHIKQLAGKPVAFPAPAAFAASILPRAEFSKGNIDIDARFVKSHDSVYLGVIQGTFAAGGGIKRTLEAMGPEANAKLRILTTTPPYTPHAFAAHPRVPADTLAKVMSALASLSEDDNGRKRLEPLSFKGITAAQDAEWDEIRRLKIEQTIGR